MRVKGAKVMAAPRPSPCSPATVKPSHLSKGPQSGAAWLQTQTHATISHSLTIIGYTLTSENARRTGRRKNRECARQGVVMAFLERLAQARAQLTESAQDPWFSKVEAAVRDKDAISTAALLDLLRAPATGTARRLAAVMRSLSFIPIKSRRLMPGGRTGNTVTRGWARPVRKMKSSPTTSNTGAVAPQPWGRSHAI